MKRHAKIQELLLVMGLAAAFAAQVPYSFADDKTPVGAKTAARAKASMEGYNDFVIDQGAIIREDGGVEVRAELRHVVDALRKHYDQANIVCAPELANVMIADVKLRAHELPEMLEAIRVASGGKFDWTGPGSSGPNLSGPPPGAIDPATGLPLAAGATPDPNSGLYVLRPPLQKGQNERVVEAFNIGPFLDRKIMEDPHLPEGNNARKYLEEWRSERTAEQVDKLQANIIETVASFKQADESSIKATLKFQYHSGANLLVAIGPRDEVEVVRKMMNALMTDPNGVRVDGIRTELVDMQGEEKLQPLSVEAIPVKFAKVESAYAAAMSLLTDKRSKVVLTDARSKTLIVQATKAELVALRAAIEQLDQASRQSAGSGSSGSSGLVPQKDH